jgi:glucosylceramidase
MNYTRLISNVIITLGVTFPLLFSSCTPPPEDKPTINLEIYTSSAAGAKMAKGAVYDSVTDHGIEIFPEQSFQTIQGFGGAFTESSSHLLQSMSAGKRKEILEAYFASDGAAYSLCRSHINSCDFSLKPYAYANVPGDSLLESFSIEVDRNDIIPTIKEAQSISENGFKLFASPWTAPPWMKDNNTWFGGKLLPKYRSTWAKYFSKYAQAYAAEGIPIWGFTVENEPLGNDSNWESMHFTPEETADFVGNYLGPQLEKDSLDIKILVYDQNRGEELEEWAQVLLQDSLASPYVAGTAVHWYSSTYDWFPQSLQNTHKLAPEKMIIQTEACVDAEVPHWNDDAWYWRKEATDWGYDWAKPEDKHLHPPYVPAYRYARDIIGCLNNWVAGWVDWNMVLDKQGGPNHAKNWCVAPVLVDTLSDEVYYTPLYYILRQFSQYIQPDAQRIGFTSSDESLLLTAIKNPDDSKVIYLLNTDEVEKSYTIKIGSQEFSTLVPAQSLQNIVIKP